MRHIRNYYYYYALYYCWMMTQGECWNYPRILLTIEQEYQILGERVQNDALMATLKNYWQYPKYSKNFENELNSSWCQHRFLQKHKGFLLIVVVPNYLFDSYFIGPHYVDNLIDWNHYLDVLAYLRPFLRQNNSSYFCLVAKMMNVSFDFIRYQKNDAVGYSLHHSANI